MPWLNPYRTPTGDPVPAAAYAIRFPAYVLWTLWGFAISWLETRRIQRLLHGIPAVVVAGVLLLLMISAGRQASSETIASYLLKAQQATRLEEYEQAEFYFRKLAQMAPRDTEIKYEHAKLYAERGNYGLAANYMQSLINDNDRTNDTNVHLDLARWAIEGKLEIDDPLVYAKANLNQVLEDDPRNLYAHYFFSQLFLRLNDLDNAIRHLEPVASKDSKLQMLLASLYGLRGDTNRSRSSARLVVQQLEKEIRDQQSADVTTWLRLAGAHLLLEEYQQATSILRQAVTKFDDDNSRKFLGRAYVRWSDAVLKENPEDIGRRMELLQRALLVAPDEPLALQRIVNIANTEGEEGVEAERWLKETLANGDAPAVIHFILGTMEAGKGDLEAAMRHFIQADQQNPKTAVTLNNMAFVLAQMDPPDLPLALEMSNQAIRIAPNVASFLETRGQILTRMGEYTKAIADLERALKAITTLSTRINVHRSLSTCYEQLGDADLARIHQEKAETLEDEASQKDQSETPASDIPQLNFEDTPSD